MCCCINIQDVRSIIMKECRSFITVECYTLLIPKSCLTHLFYIQAKAVFILPTPLLAVAPKPQRTQFSDYAPQRRTRTHNCHSKFLVIYSSITLSIPLASLYSVSLAIFSLFQLHQTLHANLHFQHQHLRNCNKYGQ